MDLSGRTPKPEMSNGHAWMLTVVVPLIIMTLCIYVASPLRDINGYLKPEAGLLVMLGAISSFAIIIYVWGYHNVK